MERMPLPGYQYFDFVASKIATNGKAAGIIANRKFLKTMVGEFVTTHWFSTSW